MLRILPELWYLILENLGLEDLAAVCDAFSVDGMLVYRIATTLAVQKTSRLITSGTPRVSIEVRSNEKGCFQTYLASRELPPIFDWDLIPQSKQSFPSYMPPCEIEVERLSTAKFPSGSCMTFYADHLRQQIPLYQPWVHGGEPAAVIGAHLNIGSTPESRNGVLRLQYHMNEQHHSINPIPTDRHHSPMHVVRSLAQDLRLISVIWSGDDGESRHLPMVWFDLLGTKAHVSVQFCKKQFTDRLRPEIWAVCSSSLQKVVFCLNQEDLMEYS